MNLAKSFSPATLHGPDKALRMRMNEATDLKAALDEHAIVTITDPQGRITFVNDKFCAISKFSRDDLLGQDHRVINSGYHSKKFFHALWGTISQGEIWHGDIKNRARDGSEYWVAITIIPFLDEQGNPQQFVAIGVDISEQKRIEAELAEKLRLQRLLAELSSRFVALSSEHVDVAIEETQRLITTTFGLDRSTLWQGTEHGPGMAVTHCWQQSGYSPVPADFQVMELLPWAHRKVMRGEIVCFKSIDDLPPEAARDAETFRKYGPLSNLTIPLISNGQTFGALGFATLGKEREWREDEVTELKLVAQIIGNVVSRQRAELREEQIRGELAHAMRVAMLGEMAATLAHELNQPLTAILSNAQAARRFIASGEIDPEEMKAILDDIVRDDKRAGGVIHNLRAMVSKRPAVRERCGLNELLQEMMELMNGEFIAERIQVRPTLASDLPEVTVARVELQQVLVNLLVNAVHAMEEAAADKRFIEIETRQDNGSVVVSIRDHGLGIPSDRLEGIFDPFFSTKASGLGMGLSICRRIIENHGGHIEAGNHNEGGASFTFSLPVK